MPLKIISRRARGPAGRIWVGARLATGVVCGAAAPDRSIRLLLVELGRRQDAAIAQFGKLLELIKEVV